MPKPLTETLLREQFTDAHSAAAELGLNHSHLCAQLRRGKFPGSFRWGTARNADWLIPRVSIRAYAETSLHVYGRPRVAPVERVKRPRGRPRKPKPAPEGAAFARSAPGRARLKTGSDTTTEEISR